MEVPQHVALQLQQLEGGQPGEGVGLDEADEVVVQVEANQTHQALEQAGVHLRQLVVAHLQDLVGGEGGSIRVGNSRFLISIAAAINTTFRYNTVLSFGVT